MSLLATLSVLTAVGYATATDMRFRRIQNWLVLMLMASGLATAAVFNGGLTLGQSAAGIGVGLVVPFILFALGMLGAGDAKLLAAIGAWFGPVGIIWVLLLTGVAGGVLAVVASAWQGSLRAVLSNTLLVGLNLATTRKTHWISATDAARAEAVEKRVTLPYSLAILGGVIGTQVLLATGMI